MNIDRKSTLIYGLALAGNVAGILVAIKRKSGFWGGVGWFILGGLAGSATGYIAAAIIGDSSVINTTSILSTGVTDDQVKAEFKNANSADVERLIVLSGIKESDMTTDQKTEFSTLFQKATGIVVNS